MIQLYTDITYNNLYLGLLEQLKKPQLLVFAETWIVVPNHSAKQWLQKSLAKDLGICAQIKFILPLSFNWEIIKNVSNQEHKINIFTTDVLRWQVSDLLINEKKYHFLKQNSDIKNFNLAEKIAQTLLKYNDEHPEVIAKWDNEVYDISTEYQWQVEMWQQLQDNLPTKSPVQLLELFDADRDFNQQPANIILFGTEQLTSLQKATILKLSNSQDILIFLSNCSPNDYWFDLKPAATKARNELFANSYSEIIEVGNPLLSSLGFNKMAIFDAFLQEDIYLQASENHYCGNNLLQSLKQDIFNLVDKPSPCPVDKSITIHSCHNRMREIEIIKDEILLSLDSDQELNPEDIIVVAPDINDYVQNINSVFTNGNSQYLPFHVDRVQLADNHYITALMKLLHSFSQEMTASVIYELLSQSTVLKKLAINENDLPRIKNWIVNSNIRNFYSAQHKEQLGFEKRSGNSWQLGKNRWLSGYLADNNAEDAYLSTYGDIAGQEDLFSRCFAFLDLWFNYYQLAQKNHTPQQWFEFIKKICQEFLYNDLADDYEKKITDQLENKFVTHTLDSQQKCPLVIVNNIVETVITENNYRSEGQIGIRFQTWENAFIVNAKLLIILGLNDEEFPKKYNKNDLDVFAKTPARLNKSTRGRDKNLMLSALTENTEKLIMTYNGFNSKTNDVQPPSVMLAEIISYLEQKTNNTFKVEVHKMHGYNQHYFQQESSSYNQKQYQLAHSYYNNKQKQPLEIINLSLDSDKDINLNELARFFIDPLNYFLKNRANLNQPIYQDILQDTETYNPTGIDSWKLKQEIFTNGKSIATKTGIVSDNKLGTSTINKYVNELDYITTFAKNIKLEKYIINKSMDDFKIFGAVDIDDKQQMVSVFPSMVKSKALCEHWIKHLCYAKDQSSYAYFQDKSIEFHPVENYDAILLEILQKWQTSFLQPWLYCPHAMLKVNTNDLNKKARENYLKHFTETKNNFPSEGQKYFAKNVELYDEQDDINLFLEPLLKCVNVINL